MQQSSIAFEIEGARIAVDKLEKKLYKGTRGIRGRDIFIRAMDGGPMSKTTQLTAGSRVMLSTPMTAWVDTHQFKVWAHNPLAMLMRAITKTLGTPIDDQVLIVNGKQLTAEQMGEPLCALRFVHDQRIGLAGRLRAAGKRPYIAALDDSDASLEDPDDFAEMHQATRVWDDLAETHQATEA